MDVRVPLSLHIRSVSAEPACLALQTNTLVRYKRYYNLDVAGSNRAELIEAVTKHFVSMVRF
jgi:Sin3 binding region of histone deacetylase complex subunit SAP30